MAKIFEGQFLWDDAFHPGYAGPIDDRMVVDTIDDLTNLSLEPTYAGMMVSVVGTDENGANIVDTYILLKGGRKYSKFISNWKKIGGTDINPDDFGARIVDSVDALTNLPFTFEGQFAIVKDTQGASEVDESGLYVLIDKTNNLWQKVISTGGSQSGDISDVITTDGTVPTSGSGLSINGNDKDAFIEEIYLSNNDVMEGNKFYTSRGLNASDKNGGELKDENFIVLSKGGGSYIKLFPAGSLDGNWIELSITDESLGLSMSDIKYIDAGGVIHTMEENPLVLPYETPISFGNDFTLNGLKETRHGDASEYVFGEGVGSTYNDVDIYTSNILPTVYAYSNGTPVKVLTEADKTEIITIIEENSEPEVITNPEIIALFDNI